MILLFKFRNSRESHIHNTLVANSLGTQTSVGVGIVATRARRWRNIIGIFVNFLLFDYLVQYASHFHYFSVQTANWASQLYFIDRRCCKFTLASLILHRIPAWLPLNQFFLPTMIPQFSSFNFHISSVTWQPRKYFPAILTWDHRQQWRHTCCVLLLDVWWLHNAFIPRPVSIQSAVNRQLCIIRV